MFRTGLAAIAGMLLIAGAAAVRADDDADCRNAKALLETDRDKAVAACRRLAENGEAWAQYSLGAMYEMGEVAPDDFDTKEAAKWYRLAAQQGDANAQHALATFYISGDGVPQDYQEADKWTRKATNHGHCHAQGNLATLYQFGTAVPQNDVKAYMWYDLAFTCSDMEFFAEKRDEVAALLNGSQIAEAQRLAREWLAAHPQPSQ